MCMVMDVGASQRDRKRNPLAVYENMTLGAELGPIGRVES